MKLWNQVLCKITGHKRGSRIKVVRDATGVVILNASEHRYSCPRCGATWARKVNVKPVPNIPASIRKDA